MKTRALLPLFIAGFGAMALSAMAEEQTAQHQAVSATPGSAPATLTQTLKDAGPKAASVVVPTTVAAIQGLGPQATPKQIGAIVYAAVRTVPDSALDIVRATVKLAPNAAPEIASAAARAVPNPWKEVHYKRSQPPVQEVVKKEPDYKSGPVDRSYLGTQDPNNATDLGDPMSLAEAIVLTAAAAGGNLADIQSAVDGTLAGDPGLLSRRVSDPRGISGVGDAGNSNYADEPHTPNTPDSPKKKKAAPHTPVVDVVSK